LVQTVISESRIIGEESRGVLDQHLVIPRFIIKELYGQTEMGDEATKSRARRCLEVIKKMEGLDKLGLRFNDTDFPEVKDITSKFIRLARLIDANILTADISRVQMASIEGVQIINLHSLSNALKPLMETGEMIKIKVQRYGKEPRQGVGYLDDGTMVVINGGGNFIGDVIDAQVLSVKHTSSGRMIFCNALEDGKEVEGSHEHGDFIDDDADEDENEE
ncbi:MAG: TRAM domain-containing protein, partial [Chlamydiia bacterium]|nr:TRAM domain-containing protein [Chlamydiia bacterium]